MEIAQVKKELNKCVLCYNETEEALKNGLWKTLPESPERMWYEIWDAENKAIKKIVTKHKPKRVIEPGCGSGRIIKLLLESGLSFEKIVGIEQKKEVHDFTRERFRKHDKVQILHHMIDENKSIPYDRNAFDLCINSSNLIGWQEREDSWIREMLRVSKLVFFTAYNKGYEKERVEMYKARKWHKDVRIDGNNNVILDNVDTFYKKPMLSKSYNEKELRTICEKNSMKYELFEISKYMYGCVIFR